ncbi:Uncharacterised protein [Mycobacteroides abscessus subsp. abscessus]|nr:Uncharacterised protein [Mycobacteroides abscessus subsp. abscessus]SIJ58676.1 Uncharacterised protein [Mycobacteroides abscessus subsp. abscessus]
MRLRGERMAAAVTATAASAPSDPARPANTPKWWVHLVGVNMIATNEIRVMPMIRRLGPLAVPGILFLRNVIATATPRAMTRASTGNRREMAPSVVGRNRRSYLTCSSNQFSDGPTADLSALAWISPTRV